MTENNFLIILMDKFNTLLTSFFYHWLILWHQLHRIFHSVPICFPVIQVLMKQLIEKSFLKHFKDKFSSIRSLLLSEK